MRPDWPVDTSVLEAARRFLTTPRASVVVACHSDVDGLTSALIVKRVLTAQNVRVHVVIARRGEHIHSPSMRDRAVAIKADALVVTDMGSRAAPVGVQIPTLIIDHHDAARGLPTDALTVNGYDREPVAPSSLLAYSIGRTLPGGERSCWLAALGALADVGTISAFRSELDCAAGGRRWSDAIALLNAARRAPEDDAATAFTALEHARSVEDLSSVDTPGVVTLKAYRERVAAELARCSRVAPRRIGRMMLIRFSSSAQVHPVVATKWTRRLAPAIVIAANDGFIAGRVNFAVRSAEPIDLLEWLRTLPFTPQDTAEYANGHARATGGSLSPDDFERFLDAVRGQAA